MFGGDVKGRQIVGSYPGNLTDDGELSLGRGRMIATTSWDAVFLPLAEWAGVEESNLDNVCPNRGNFPASHFIDTADLFEFNTPSPTISNSPTMSSIPTAMPVTTAPTKHPVTQAPTTSSPTIPVTSSPTSAPPSSVAPTSTSPSESPLMSPSFSPSSQPTSSPSSSPSQSPSISPSPPPTPSPSSSPSRSPSISPSSMPTSSPSYSPSQSPSKSPSSNPSISPSMAPTSASPVTQAPSSLTPSSAPPTSTSPSSTSPTGITPSSSPTAAPTLALSCLLKAKKVKIISARSRNLNFFAVHVLSSGIDIATNKIASQSSTVNDNTSKYGASRAVDGLMNTFSFTKRRWTPQWWEVDLGSEYPIESVTIMNRWCQDISDPKECLCRLSGGTIELLDDQDVVIATQSVGEDTCGQVELLYQFCQPSTI